MMFVSAPPERDLGIADSPDELLDRELTATRSSVRLVPLALVLAVFVALAWGTTRVVAVESAYLEALDVELNAAVGAIELAQGEADALARDAALLHLWIEENEPVGSGALIEALQRLAAAPPVRVSHTVHDDLMATGRYREIRNAPLRRALIHFYSDAARLEREPIAGGAELTAALDAGLPLGAWRHVLAQRGGAPQPLSYEEAVRALHDRGFGVPVRTIVRGLAARSAELDSLHAAALSTWRDVRREREGSR